MYFWQRTQCVWGIPLKIREQSLKNRGVYLESDVQITSTAPSTEQTAIPHSSTPKRQHHPLPPACENTYTPLR